MLKHPRKPTAIHIFSLTNSHTQTHINNSWLHSDYHFTLLLLTSASFHAVVYLHPLVLCYVRTRIHQEIIASIQKSPGITTTIEKPKKKRHRASRAIQAMKASIQKALGKKGAVQKCPSNNKIPKYCRVLCLDYKNADSETSKSSTRPQQ